ncbi:MAG: hypothetical protein QOG20_2092 [Pseudonocardiales bacterium]|jgi:hypothetical protein|nr:hypothetical protein [Pseudonocardiales bacterium]
MTDQPSTVGRPVATTKNGTAAEPIPASQQRTRRAIASTTTYAEAERIVDRLADLKFPVERVAIVGHDLELVEQVVGKMTWGRALWRGALSGAVPGVLIGWIFGLFSWVNPVIAGLLLALYGLIFGAVIGAVVGLIIYVMQRGRRDFMSVAQMRPNRYEVVADDEVADEALRLLGGGI